MMLMPQALFKRKVNVLWQQVAKDLASWLNLSLLIMATIILVSISTVKPLNLITE